MNICSNKKGLYNMPLLKTRCTILMVSPDFYVLFDPTYLIQTSNVVQ